MKNCNVVVESIVVVHWMENYTVDIVIPVVFIPQGVKTGIIDNSIASEKHPNVVHICIVSVPNVEMN